MGKEKETQMIKMGNFLEALYIASRHGFRKTSEKI